MERIISIAKNAHIYLMIFRVRLLNRNIVCVDMVVPLQKGMKIVSYYYREATMFEFHEKRKIKSVLYSRTTLAVLLVPILLMSYVAYGAYEKKEQASERREALSAELAVLENRAYDLEKDIAILSDPRGIESELRNRYEVGREGEEVIVFIDEEPEQDAGSSSTEVLPEKTGIWERFFGTLF